jgi:hypothetical protein
MGYARMLAAVFVAGYVATAAAQTGFTDKMKSCANLADDRARLACYDAAVAGIDAEAAKAATERKRQAEVRAQELAAREEADRKAAAAKAEQAKVNAFGAEALPADLKPDSKTESIDELEGAVSEVFYSPLKEIIVVLENGQMWRQSDTTRVGTVKKGDKVLIKKRTLSGYRMTFVRQKRSIDIKRFR